MVLTPRRYQVHSYMSILGFVVYEEINVKEENFGISSSSTFWEDHEARHKSRHEVNTTPNDPKTEASTRKTPGTWMFTNEINSAQEIFSQPRIAWSFGADSET
jgi:hypothetical protein